MFDKYLYIRNFNQVDNSDITLVGGKNASLGEMTQSLLPLGINIPEGFVITTKAFDVIFQENNLSEIIVKETAVLDIQNISELKLTGEKIRSLIRQHGIHQDVLIEIKKAYQELCHVFNTDRIDVAVRSSATAEDLPEASFAGQQETYLNITGPEELINACLNCYASLFTDRAISYRAGLGIDHKRVKLSIGVQRMIRSDLASSGVIFTLDTESGADNVIIITSAYGLGENIVGGKVDPDEFIVSKPLIGKSELPILRKKLGSKQFRLVYSSDGHVKTKNIETSISERKKYSLTDYEIIELAEWAKRIEEYYSHKNKKYTPMDIEWAKDGKTGKLYILQARPETIYGQRLKNEFEIMKLEKHSEILLKGVAVGNQIGSGPVRIINDVNELSSFKEGEILVAEMTNPDWVPVMKKASGIITNSGGRTCHAAIVSREYGVPCIVGTGNGTEILKNNQKVTISCSEGEVGLVMEGILPFSTKKITSLNKLEHKTKIMVNVGNPDVALKTSTLPVDGVGLARIEFIIAEHVKIHPLALINLNDLKNKNQKQKILEIIEGYEKNPAAYFVNKLCEGIAMIAGAFYPKPVIVRFSDFKTNEYSHLIGGEEFEPIEENPMIGFRGASRYYSSIYRKGFELECLALKKVRDEIGLKNVITMIPFCRTPHEGKLVLDEMAKNGLIQGCNGLQVYVMCEIPSNVLDLSSFAEIFDGFSIGSNDLTQMTLGVDRDSELMQKIFNEKEPAVLKIIEMAINEAKACGRPIGICGQGPSDFPELTSFLIKHGIDSISLTADSVIPTIERVGRLEKNMYDHNFIEQSQI